MEGIAKSQSIVHEQPRSKRNKALKHVANASVVGGGLYLSKKANDALMRSLSAYNPQVTGKRKAFGEYFQKLGEKLFPSEVKSKGGFKMKNPVHELIELYAKEHFPQAKVPHMMSTYKAKLAAVLATGVTALGILFAGFYKAGKINGEGK